MTIRNQKGLTLVEMLVSIGIIAILSALLLTVLNPLGQFQKANDAKRKADLTQVQRALEQYYQDIGMYPKSSNNADGKSDYFIVGLDNAAVPWGSAWVPYMDLLPKDPLDPTHKYAYYTSSDRQTYWLYTSLERGNLDPQVCKGNNNNNLCDNASQLSTNACGAGFVCNFGVSSPNTTP